MRHDDDQQILLGATAPTTSESGPFSTFVTHAEGTTVVHLRGDLDMASAPALDERLARLPVERSPLVLDASRLEFCDSSGLGVLIKHRKRLQEQGARLVVRAPGAALQRLLDLTRLDDLVETDAPGAGAPGADAAALSTH